MWWQGEENAPETVKLCLASIKKHCGSHKFVIITKNNLQKYLDLPEHILSKVNAGDISLAHLSDIVRTNLLLKYGGLWIDSTMFVAKVLPDEAFTMEYYSCNCIPAKLNFLGVPECKWSIWFFAARRNSLLFSFVAEMLSEYLKTHKRFIEYFLMDLIIAIAFQNFPEINNEWNKIPCNNPEWGCFPCSEEWNADTYSDLISSTTVFKMSYKGQYDTQTLEGRQTFYGHMLSEYGIAE